MTITTDSLEDSAILVQKGKKKFKKVLFKQPIKGYFYMKKRQKQGDYRKKLKKI